MNAPVSLRPSAYLEGFQLSDLSYSVGEARIVRGVSARFGRNRVYGLIGPNGSGKTSLIRMLARQAEPSSGVLRYGGKALRDWNARGFAREVAYVPQHLPHAQHLTVGELVALGRYPWHGPFGRPSTEDRAIVAGAMRVTASAELAHRMVDTLSGGERQRAWVAMMIAQAGHFLLLDEPTSALDIAHQAELLTLLRDAAVERGLGIVMAFHDLNIAARFCDEVLALKQGALIAAGTPEEIIRPDLLSELYGVPMGIVPHPGTGRPIGFVQ